MYTFNIGSNRYLLYLDKFYKLYTISMDYNINCNKVFKSSDKAQICLQKFKTHCHDSWTYYPQYKKLNYLKEFEKINFLKEKWNEHARWITMYKVLISNLETRFGFRILLFRIIIITVLKVYKNIIMSSTLFYIRL